MSIKKYFENVSNIKALSGKTSHDIGGQVESAEYHEQDIINEERFIPDVDFTKPENFARYGSAEEYYSTAITRIYETYPYDGSLKERLEWQNKSTYLDLYIYDDRYPRTNGYIIFSSASWGTQQSTTDGYGLSDTLEYISFEGGPNKNPNGLTPSSVEFTGSNYYETAMNRKSNLQLDLASEGASVEFWMKKDAFDTTKTQKEVIFDLWNGKGYAAPDYARLTVELTSSTGHAIAGADPFRLTIYSGALGFQTASVCSSNFTTASVTDGKWHHYAFTLKSASAGVQSRFYVDGELENEATIQTTGSVPPGGAAGINDIDFYGMRATIGALATNPSASTAATGSGKLSASLDEFRYWKTQRTGEQIGRFWFTQVGGGVNTDPTPFITTKETANTDLGVYYKFNEGITGQASTDSTVLDYSGRLSNGAWTGYTSGARNTGSAIVLSTAAIKEFKDPIIYPFHPRVHELLGAMRSSGSSYDVNNNASIYNSIPSWIIDDDSEGSGDVKKLTQILSSYFDTLHMQIDNLTRLKDISYISGSNKPLPFSEKLLTSYGFIAPELFLDADILEKLADRSEDKVYEKSLEEIKNIIYQNIYNNLSYIYKSKGTEKGFRNLIRCFGIDDELIKINMYADGIEYNLDNDRRNIIVTDRYINFNTANNKFGSVFNYQDHTNSVGFITSSTSLSDGHSFTLETELLLPLKPLDSSATYIDTNVISSSLFGAHGVVSDAGLNQTGWPTGKMSDAVNFQVYAVRDELGSTNARFVLTGSTGGYVPSLKSPLYENVYSNTKWNLSVRVRPENYPLANFASASNNGNFVVELHGVQAESGEILQEFTLSGTVTNPTGSFITGSKRAYVGAHRTDFTSSILATSDVKVNACRYWLDYLDDETLKGHVLDTENHGNLLTHQYAYGFNPSASNGDITKFDTLVFNWEFLNNTGSDASGQFTVEDISSGSADFTRFGSLGKILNRQYTALGYDFATSSVSPIDKDFVVSSKLNLPENIQSTDMVKVLSTQEQDVFTNDSRPINYYFAFEKSMYQVVSEEIINYFANLKDFHNLIGDPVNLYRPEYKSLKFLRQKFFEKVANQRLDFDKFYEFYKWFDSSLSAMLVQLVPATADFSDSVRTIIEDHVLERSKNRRIFPFLERKGATDITASVEGGGDANASLAPESPPGSGFFTNTAFTKRQIGSSNTLQINPWKHIHAPVRSQGNSDALEKDNIYWWRYEAERDVLPLNRSHAGTSSTGATSARTDLLRAIRQSYNRRVGSPAKFSVEGAVTFGGVARHQSNQPNYVFREVAPLPGASGSLTNILVTQKADVEELISSSSDVYYPSTKQRLGFKMNPDINTDTPNDRTLDGNVYAPFSLYSSSVTDGYASRVASSFMAGVEITNLHHDYVKSHDIPMQGPFTEKFVGGRFYRHTPLNRTGSNGTGRLLDNDFSRGEAFRIQLAGVSSTDGGNFSNSLAIIPADSSGSATTRDFPTAVRFRDETAKRPVNIKNILMTTASLDVKLSGTIMHSGIGNYQKNYQVVQSAGRTSNDPFFKDQSFNFAEFPETLATRGRLPLFEPDPVVAKSILFDDSLETRVYDTEDSAWEGALSDVSTDGLTISFWFNYTGSPLSTPRLVNLGTIQSGIFKFDGFSMRLYFADPNWVLYANLRDPTAAASYAQGTTGLAADTWYHAIIEFPAGALDGSDSAIPAIYLNNSLEALANSDGAADWRTLDALDTGISLGDHGVLSDPYNGYLCDVAIINKSINSAERALLYNDGKRTNIALDGLNANLVAYYRLGNKSVQGNADSTTGDIYNSVIDNDIPNATPDNFTNTATNGIKGQSPSTIVLATDWPALIVGPLQKPTANPGGNLNYALPARTGSDSNETIFVNRFAGSGYEVMSLGYMDPAHEELSVYNASPYHNLAIIDYGLSGSAVADPLAARTITVVDQIDKNRGLDQRATLHCGPFGSDAAYGSVPSATYVTVPSWHKTNRNVKYRIVDSYGQGFVTSSNYDNLYVQHQIPQSDMQYSWISASARGNIQVWGLSPETCTSASVLRTVSGSGRIVGFGENGLQLNSSSYYPGTSSGGQPYTLENGRGTPISFANCNLEGPVAARPIDMGQHILHRPQGAFNRRSFYMSGTLDSRQGSWIHVGTAGHWNNIIGGSGADAKPFTIAFWMRPKFNMGVSGRVYDFAGELHALVTPLPAGGAIEEVCDFSWTRYGVTSNGTLKSSMQMMWGEWYHCIMTFDGGDPDGDITQTSQRTYINGKADSYYSTYLDNPRAFSGRSCYFGNSSGAPDDGSGDGRNFYGDLDEIMIFASSVNDVQAEILFNHYTPADPYVLEIDNPEIKETVQSMVMWWRGDRDVGVYGHVNDAPAAGEISGAVIHDHSGNGNDGVIGLGSTAKASNPQNYFRLTSSVPANAAGYSFNAMLLNQNGPYGWPTWKQIRAGENPIARQMRKQNLIGSVLPPSTVIDDSALGAYQSLSPNEFADYYESPISDANLPINFIFEDNTENADSANNMQVTVPYANQLEYFSHNGLNNLLNLKIDTTRRRAYNSVLDYAVQSNLSLVANYAQRVYPSEKNAYRSTIRGRQDYNISTIWFDNRSTRTFETLESAASCSMGYRRVLSQSMWPLDGHNNFKTTSSMAYPYHNDGAGEMLASYTCFTGSTDDPMRVSRSSSAEANADISAFPNQYAGPMYAQKIYGGKTLVDDFPILAGDAEWLVAEQAGKAPYQDYKTYENHIREVGKDHSIIPEFRISEHMETYVDGEENNFLTEIDGLFEITGAAYSSSAEEPFFKTYSNGDFLKYFKVIDDDLFGKRPAPLTIVRDKITLSCDGLIKFLPYKGFTPAERTVELARLFSASYAPSVYQKTTDPTVDEFGLAVGSSGVDAKKRFRILMDPLFSPGILYNTVKSGIAMSNFIICHTASTVAAYPMQSGSMISYHVTASDRPKGGVKFEEGYLYMGNIMSVGRMSELPPLGMGVATDVERPNSCGYNMQKVPFEALYNPEAFFNSSVLTGLSPGSGTIGPAQLFTPEATSGRSGGPFIYDRNPSSSVAHVPSFLTSSLYVNGGSGPELQYPQGNAYFKMKELQGSALYRMAIDNFLCETSHLYSNGFANFQSKREENFSSVVSGSIYTMQVRLFRTAQTGSVLDGYHPFPRNEGIQRGRTIPDRKRFTMYSRESAFGPPVFGHAADRSAASPSFAHCSPPYYNHPAAALLTYSASVGGIPTLQDIYDNLTIELSQQQGDPGYLEPAAAPAMAINSCLNLTERLLSVPEGTQVQKSSWVIQSKFETPVINFAQVSASSPPSGTMTAGDDASLITTKGMWHQYGTVPSASDNGIFIDIQDLPISYNRDIPGYTPSTSESLANVVGFTTGAPTRIGRVPDEHKFEEAIVAVPFKTVENQRQFFALNVVTEASNTYQNILGAMDKYVFPPKMDFIRHPNFVTPILMYIFEFEAKLTKKDLTDMWQNLMPSIATKFEQKKVVVEDKELVDLLANNTEDVRWMVFKVKRRAKKNFERFRRSMLTSDLTGYESDPIGPHSYNWPYDYFSLVELAKIDEGVQYKSADLINQIDTNEAGSGGSGTTTGGGATSGTPTGGGATAAAVGGATATGGGATATGGGATAKGGGATAKGGGRPAGGAAAAVVAAPPYSPKPAPPSPTPRPRFVWSESTPPGSKGGNKK